MNQKSEITFDKEAFGLSDLRIAQSVRSVVDSWLRENGRHFPGHSCSDFGFPSYFFVSAAVIEENLNRETSETS